MLKSYDELIKIDVTPWCEDRDGFKYLNWARCIALLRENGAEQAYFEPIPNPETGSSLYMTDKEFTDKYGVVNRIYETRIKVVVDDNEWVFQSPVLNGQNPVKDNSMNQLRVWGSMCRAFVKCVAIHTGLGFNLWIREEEAAINSVPLTQQSGATPAQIKTLEKLCKAHSVNFEAWLNKVDRTRETLTADEAGAMLKAMKEKYEDE